MKNVRSTKIFARAGEGATQYIAYEMNLTAPRDVAMVLPVPVDRTRAEKSLNFINLEKSPFLFASLDQLFTPMNMGSVAMRGMESKIEVQKVGAYDASFVPTPQDFARLDERFRMPANFWEGLPQYKKWSFAVFKLRPGEGRYHPMAFSFDRTGTRWLFFPTVHVHDGKVRERAKFDHELYCQPGNEKWNLEFWEESSRFASNIQTPEKLVNPEGHVYRKAIKGIHANKDMFLTHA